MRARRRTVEPYRQKMNFLNTAIQRVPFAVKPRGVSQTLCWGKRVSHTALYRPRAAPESSARAGRKPYARLKGVSSLDIDRTMMPFAAPAPPTIRAACPAKNPRGMGLHRPQRSTTHLRARRRGRERERERAIARLILIALSSCLVRWKAGIDAVIMRTPNSCAGHYNGCARVWGT